MKKEWKKPEVVELEVVLTEQWTNPRPSGNNISFQ
jgi:hypothetical protein